jgi:cell division protein FtsZ
MASFIELDDLQSKPNGIKMFIDEPPVTGARIKVIGVGGGGGNVVNRMIASGIKGVEFIVANTDVQALDASKAPIKLQLGTKSTKGLGAGADPNVGRNAALEDCDKLIELIEGADMVFVTAGLGGGTGTGAAPIVASLAMELDILTVAVVTKPFKVEGRKRQLQAEVGLAELRGSVDTLITIPNSNLSSVEKDITVVEAFRRADDVLLQAVKGITELITRPGLINLDFADVKTVMRGKGVALMGVGAAKGENAASNAMRSALDSKLLEENSIKGAKAALINITGSSNMVLTEVENAVGIIEAEADDDADIILGSVIDEEMGDEVRITVIATGFDAAAASAAAAPEHPQVKMPVQPAHLAAPVSPAAAPENMEVPTFLRRQAD